MGLIDLRFRSIFFALLLSSVQIAYPLSEAHAQSESVTEPTGYIRRITVFPLKGISGSIAESVWWKVRERMAEDRRFLIATRNFMNQKNVFQSRGELSPADVILLSKLLGSHALVTAELLDFRIKTVTVRAYDGVDGLPLWNVVSQLDPSKSVESQIEGILLKLVDQLLKDFRFDGSTILDPIVGTPIYQEGDVHLAKVDMSEKLTPKVGQKIQWIHFERKTVEPLFQGGGTESILAEGEVYDVNREIVTVRILRKKSSSILKEKTLVRMVRENESSFSLDDQSKSITIEPGWISGTQGDPQAPEPESKPLVTALSILTGVVAFLLLAF